MGKPIDCDADPNPSQEAIDKLHARYISGLRELYYENCDLYDSNRSQGIELVA